MERLVGDPCHGKLKRLTVEFECSGEGRKVPSWFDAGDGAIALMSAPPPPAIAADWMPGDGIFLVKGTKKDPTACGFGYEVDFMHLICEPDDMVIQKIVFAQYAVLDNELCMSRDGTAKLRGAYESRSWPQPRCGKGVEDIIRRDCVGKRWCKVYVPMPDTGDPCIGDKKAVMAIGICGPR